MKPKAALFFVFIVFFSLPAYCQSAEPGRVLDITPVRFPEKIRPGQSLDFELKFNLREGWHINSDRPNSDYMIPSGLELAANRSFKLEVVHYPEPVEYEFDFAEEPINVFEDGFSVSGRIRAEAGIESGIYELVFEFVYQACRRDTCLKPESARLIMDILVEGPPMNSGETGDFVPNKDYSEPSGTAIQSRDNFSRRIESAGLLLSLVLVFTGGLALNLTPCVYPIIPITISYFGAQSEGRTSRLFFLGLLFVTGMAVTYSAIGVITSLTGGFFGGLLQQPVVLIAISAFFIVLALSMFGFYEFRLPQKWMDSAGSARAGLLGALLMGLSMGIIAAPCIGPLVLGLAAYVAARGDPFYGFFLFFFMALGLGTPYLFLALFSGKIKSLPRSGEWMEGVRHILGFALLGAAVYFVAPLLPDPLYRLSLPVFGILAAGYLLFFDKTGNRLYGFRIFKVILCFILIGFSAYFIFPGDDAGKLRREFSMAAYELALEKNRNMVIIFHADWCIPCRELEKQTLSEPEVSDKLRNFEVFGVDMTYSADPEARVLLDRFEVKGVPTILLIDSNGKQVQRIEGLIEPGEFMEALSLVE